MLLPKAQKPKPCHRLWRHRCCGEAAFEGNTFGGGDVYAFSSDEKWVGDRLAVDIILSADDSLERFCDPEGVERGIHQFALSAAGDGHWEYTVHFLSGGEDFADGSNLGNLFQIVIFLAAVRAVDVH